MKKIISFSLVVAALLAMAACSREGEYKDFASRVAGAVAQNDTVALKSMIYGGRQLSFAHIGMAKLDVSKAVMTQLDDGGYKVVCGKQYMVIKPVYGDSLQVVEAGNVFTCTAPVMMMVARQRGIVDNLDDDIAMLRGFSSRDFAIVWKQHLAGLKYREDQVKGEAVARKNIDDLLTQFREQIGAMKEWAESEPMLTGSSSFIRGLGGLDDLNRQLEAQRKLMTPAQEASFASAKKAYSDFLNFLETDY